MTCGPASWMGGVGRHEEVSLIIWGFSGVGSSTKFGVQENHPLPSQTWFFRMTLLHFRPALQSLGKRLPCFGNDASDPRTQVIHFANADGDTGTQLEPKLQATRNTWNYEGR